MNQRLDHRYFVPMVFLFLGVLFVCLPQLVLVSLVPLGFVVIIRKPINMAFEIGLIVLGSIYGFLGWRAGQMPLIVLLGLIFWLLFRACTLNNQSLIFWLTQKHRTALVLGMGLGLFGLLVYAVLLELAPKPERWFPVNGVRDLEITKTDQLTHIRSKEPGLPWVIASLGMQGPGEFSLEVSAHISRETASGVVQGSSREVAAIHVLFHPGLEGGRAYFPCRIGARFMTCRFNAKLLSRGEAALSIGGFALSDVEVLEIKPVIAKTLPEPALWVRLAELKTLYGPTSNPNTFGAWMAIMAIFAAVLVRGVWQMPFFALALVATLISESRTASVCVILCALVLIILPYARRLAQVLLLVGAFSVVLVPILIVKGAPWHSLPLDARAWLYRLAWDSFVQSPVFGVGDFRALVQKNLDDEALKLNINQEFVKQAHAHNVILQVLSQSGLVGLVVLMGILALIIGRIWARRDDAALVVLAAAAILCSSDWFLDFPPVYTALLFAVVGISSRKPSPQPRLRAQSSSPNV